MKPIEGMILLSGTDDHLVLGAHRRLYYSAEPGALTYRPSIDVFFKSVAGHWPRSGVAALLTGMGRDGAEGLLQLRAWDGKRSLKTNPRAWSGACPGRPSRSARPTRSYLCP